MSVPAPEILAAFEAAKGFMPAGEGLALYEAAAEAAKLGLPLLEVGTYCGRSTILLADVARQAGTVAVTVDHHRGSEEQQPGWEYHDETVVDPEVGLMDTLPTFRRTLRKAGLEEHVIAVVGRSPQVAKVWGGQLGLVFIDGGHTDEHATNDYEGWAPKVAPGACSSSTTSSPTRPTAARPRTGSTSARSSRATSRRSRSPTRCGCCAAAERGGQYSEVT